MKMLHYNENNGMCTESTFWLTINFVLGFYHRRKPQESNRTIPAERQVHIISKFDIFRCIKQISKYIFWITIYSGPKSQFQLGIPKFGPAFPPSPNIRGIQIYTFGFRVILRHAKNMGKQSKMFNVCSLAHAGPWLAVYSLQCPVVF